MSDSASEGGPDVSRPRTNLTNDPLYNYEQCIAALEGTRVPDDLRSSTARCAVIRGLRCSYDFCNEPRNYRPVRALATISRISSSTQHTAYYEQRCS
ncbi:uncharacterized protein BDV17DRAFT_260299 [Aspergillus undulatus]|uniref:uncharacterized protein n=1 Tax=Aspergillus undulatus TaxID=1810928 RepID=UPI003CCD7BF5